MAVYGIEKPEKAHLKGLKMEANEERPSVPTASSANLEGIVVKMPSKAYLGANLWGCCFEYSLKHDVEAGFPDHHQVDNHHLGSPNIVNCHHYSPESEVTRKQINYHRVSPARGHDGGISMVALIILGVTFFAFLGFLLGLLATGQMRPQPA